MNMMIGVYADQQTLRAIGLAVVWPKTGINNRTLVIKFVPQSRLGMSVTTQVGSGRQFVTGP